ncbi:MAG: FtsQ-type POTRA domain-containing protein [Erysipelotrichales bacterium]|nr:FtsQ-type POTRA domain-containing protein [Erysipelotrichales bacterium]
MAREKDDELIFTNNVDKMYMLEKRRKVRLEKRIQSNAWILRLLFVCLFIAYLASDFSKIKCISVEGNSIYSKDYVVESSGLSFDSYYYGFAPSLAEHRIKQATLVDSVDITRKGDNIVLISLEEKQVVGSFQKDSELYYLCSDGEFVKVTNESLSYMSKVPFIVDLEEDEELLKKLAKPLSKVDEDVLSMMSEIVWYPLTYDEMQLKINMIDRNYVFISIYDVELINDYRRITASLGGSGECVYFDSKATHPYTSECLFDMVDEEGILEDGVDSGENIKNE